MTNLQTVLELNGYEEWEADGEDLLICPHGERVEMDGRCPEGCVSPVRALGLI